MVIRRIIIGHEGGSESGWPKKKISNLFIFRCSVSLPDYFFRQNRRLSLQCDLFNSFWSKHGNVLNTINWYLFKLNNLVSTFRYDFIINNSATTIPPSRPRELKGRIDGKMFFRSGKSKNNNKLTVMKNKHAMFRH